MKTSEEPILLDGKPVTDYITLTWNDVKHRYRQLVPEHWVIPMQDTILDVAGNRIYTVAATAINLSTMTIKKIMILEEDGITVRYLNLNEVRILHDIKSFDPLLN